MLGSVGSMYCIFDDKDTCRYTHANHFEMITSDHPCLEMSFPIHFPDAVITGPVKPVFFQLSHPKFEKTGLTVRSFAVMVRSGLAVHPVTMDQTSMH